MKKKDLKKIKNLRKNIKYIKSGDTSSTFSSPFLFVKYIIKFNKYDIYKREKYLGSILKKFDWYPKLLYLDDKNKFFIYSNVGVPVTIKNKPNDLEKQFNKILKDMKSVNVQHNDIKSGEILIDENKKIYLCDFGWGSINNDLGCGIGLCNISKPFGCLNDSNALKRLGLI